MVLLTYSDFRGPFYEIICTCPGRRWISAGCVMWRVRTSGTQAPARPWAPVGPPPSRLMYIKISFLGSTKVFLLVRLEYTSTSSRCGRVCVSVYVCALYVRSNETKGYKNVFKRRSFFWVERYSSCSAILCVHILEEKVGSSEGGVTLMCLPLMWAFFVVPFCSSRDWTYSELNRSWRFFGIRGAVLRVLLCARELQRASTTH